MKKFLLWVLNMAAAMSLFTFSTSASAQIGSLSKDLVFTPLAPCRIMDTRNPGAISGILVAGSTRTFYGNSSATNYPSQGGLLATCGLPVTRDVAAIVLNVTVTDSAGAGYITLFPANAAKPLASSVNFTAGAVVANNATLKISQAHASGQFKIFSTSNVHVVADILGYYAQPLSTALECVDTVWAIATVAAGASGIVIALACTAGYTQTATNCNISSYSLSLAFSYDGQCGAKNNGATPANIHASRTCCRIPGR